MLSSGDRDASALNWFQGNDVDSPAEGPENWLGKRITVFGRTAAPPLAGKGERPRSQEDRSGAVFLGWATSVLGGRVRGGQYSLVVLTFYIKSMKMM
jgi:hypothetical protein